MVKKSKGNSTNSNVDVRQALLDRQQYWNRDVASQVPPGLFAPIGILLAGLLPYTLYFYILPDSPSGEVSIVDRLTLLAKLQILPAMVYAALVPLSGLPRIQHSPASAHDPALMHALFLLPLKTHAALRAMANTNEQYILLLASSLSLVVQIDASMLNALPALYITWCLARMLYFFGYTSDSSHRRMLGFPATVIPTVSALSYSIYLASTQPVSQFLWGQ